MSSNLRSIQSRQNAVDIHFAKYASKTTNGTVRTVTISLPDNFEHWTGPGSELIDDKALIAKIKASAQGTKFSALYSGDTSQHNNDDSSADMALAVILVFWLGSDIDRIDRVFRTSKLMREKWDSSRPGGTYGRNTIIKAIRFAAQRNDLDEDLLDDLEADPNQPNYGNSKATRIDDSNQSDVSQSVERKYHFISAENLQFNPTSNYLIKNLIIEQSLILIYGESNSGKTFAVVGLCCDTSLGKDWNGLKTRKCTVAYVAEEGGAGVTNRVLAYRRAHKIDKSSEMSLYLLDDQVDLRSPEYDLQELIAAIEQFHVKGTPLLIVIDTLARAMAGADENAADAMSLMLASIAKLQRHFGAAVILIHHSGKKKASGERGHSSLRAACDTSIFVEKVGHNGIKMSVQKQRDLEGGQEFDLKLHQVELGRDSDGEPITSCIVNSDTGQDLSDDFNDLADPAENLPPQARKAYRLILKMRQELFRTPHSGDQGVCSQLPLRVATMESLRSFLTDAHLANSSEHSDSHRKAADRVLNQLVKHKILTTETVGESVFYSLLDEVKSE